MKETKKNSLSVAIVFSIALPLLWLSLLTLRESMLGKALPETFHTLISLASYPIVQFAYFLGMPDDYAVMDYILYILTGVLLFLACIGFCSGFLFSWGYRYISNNKQECDE